MLCFRLLAALAFLPVASSATAAESVMLQGSLSTPEPAAIVGVGLVSLALFSLRRRRA
jgi:hypothetical protein